MYEQASDRIPISTSNKKRLHKAGQTHLKYHPEDKYVKMTYNRALGIVLDFWEEDLEE